MKFSLIHWVFRICKHNLSSVYKFYVWNFRKSESEAMLIYFFHTYIFCLGFTCDLWTSFKREDTFLEFYLQISIAISYAIHNFKKMSNRFLVTEINMQTIQKVLWQAAETASIILPTRRWVAHKVSITSKYQSIVLTTTS